MADPAIQAPTKEIPDKLYFRIGEVSQLVGVEAYVLRYWESEFPNLSPKKSGTGHRLYRKKDVELLLKIKHLLYDRRYTIEGARQVIHDEPKTSHRKRQVRAAVAGAQEQGNLFAGDLASAVGNELREILALLKD